MVKRTALTQEAAWKAKQMYAEVDARGRRVWSLQAIADYLGVGETTVFRAVNNSGPYARLPEVRSKEDMQRAAKESFARLMEMGAVQLPDGQAIPPSPLDGGEPPEETDGSTREELAKAVHLRDADASLRELIGEGKDGK